MIELFSRITWFATFGTFYSHQVIAKFDSFLIGNLHQLCKPDAYLLNS